MKKNERLSRFDKIDIYPVTCEKLSNGRSDVEVLEGVIAGGAKIIQLREKELSMHEFRELAMKFRKITKKNNVLLIINDHVEIAVECGADGVHLGQDDMPTAEARSIAAGLIIGVSTHNREEAKHAQRDGADYVNIGPIFPTQTKVRIGNFLGPDRIRTISTRLTIPFTVMGGINRGNIDEVIRAGATKIAVVTAITKADDIAEATRKLIRSILNSRYNI